MAWLSFASGCTDVLSFLKIGYVFTSAMTGNAALLAIAIGRGQMLVASRCVTALFGFVLGVALGTVIYAPVDSEQNGRHRLRRLLLLETVFLGGCAALWSVSRDPVQGSALYTPSFCSPQSVWASRASLHTASMPRASAPLSSLAC
ncbi:MAG: DUF1275 family protein [Syntrophobacteraceae bacterium]